MINEIVELQEIKERFEELYETGISKRYVAKNVSAIIRKATHLFSEGKSCLDLKGIIELIGKEIELLSKEQADTFT
jgi:hypothetical protein